MLMISDDDKRLLETRFRDELREPVTMYVFTRTSEDSDQPGPECEFCRETEMLVTEVGALSDKIALDIREFDPSDEIAKQYGVDKLPAVVIAGRDSGSATFYGIPGGFEFNSFIDLLVDVSRNTTTLPDAVKEKVRGVRNDLHLQVFYTLTCPYCPSAVRTAQQMAIENPAHIRADAIEASEFPNLVNRYDVIAVPTIVINDQVQFEGALPEAEFVDHVLEAA